MPNQAIFSDRAPAAIGPYSQAIRRGRWLYCSGQTPLSPETGTLVEGGIDVQTRQVLRNIEHVLAAGGATFADVVKATVYLTDMGDFQAMNAIYGEAFDDAPPARSTVAVAGLPKGARVEIDVIAYTGVDG